MPVGNVRALGNKGWFGGIAPDLLLMRKDGEGCRPLHNTNGNLCVILVFTLSLFGRHPQLGVLRFLRSLISKRRHWVVEESGKKSAEFGYFDRRKCKTSPCKLGITDVPYLRFSLLVAYMTVLGTLTWLVRANKLTVSC